MDAEINKAILEELKLIRTALTEKLTDIHTTLRQMNAQLNNMNK